MIDLELEIFTAQEAIEAGLIEAVRRGETKITGNYTLTSEGFINYKQKPFIFTDKFGNLRYGRFKDTFHDIAEITSFSALWLESLVNNEISGG